VIGALLLAAAPLSFEGIALGDDAAKIAAAHQGTRTFTALGPAFSWHRRGGGTLMIASDAAGKVVLVDFVPDRGEEDAVALPGAGDFGVLSSRVDLAASIGPPVAACRAQYLFGSCGVYALAGGSELVAQFEGPGDGSLVRATWAEAATILRLRIAPPASP